MGDERIFGCRDGLSLCPDDPKAPRKIGTTGILAMDLGKFNSVFGRFDQESKKIRFLNGPLVSLQILVNRSERRAISELDGSMNQ